MRYLIDVTEQHIVEGWEKWGDGAPFKPGFAAWLADELNKPFQTHPFAADHIADIDIKRNMDYICAFWWRV